MVVDKSNNFKKFIKQKKTKIKILKASFEYHR